MSLSEKLLTPKEASEALRGDLETVARWRKSGKIKGVRLPNGRYLYDPAEIRRQPRRA